MGTSRNRNAGHAYELECVENFKLAGYPDVVTSRSENRARDAEKVDIVNHDELKTGRLPFNVQCKTTVSTLSYEKYLNEIELIEGITNVVLHKKTKKSEKGRFIAKQRYAFMHEQDFFTLVKERNMYKEGYELLKTFATLTPSEQEVMAKSLADKLKEIGL